MSSNTKQLSRDALATTVRSLTCRHSFNREVIRAPSNQARTLAALRAEHTYLKKCQALGLTGLDRAMVAARREALDAAAAQLGYALR